MNQKKNSYYVPKYPVVPQHFSDGLRASKKTKIEEFKILSNRSFGNRTSFYTSQVAGNASVAGNGDASSAEHQVEKSAQLDENDYFNYYDNNDDFNFDGLDDDDKNNTELRDAEDLLRGTSYGYDNQYSSEVSSDDDSVSSTVFTVVNSNVKIEEFKRIFRFSSRVNMPVDGSVIINPHSSNADQTKELFCLRLAHIQAATGASDKDVSVWLQLFKEFCPEMALPLVEIGSAGNVKPTFRDYVEPDIREHKVHCCLGGCTAYINENMYDIECKKCHTKRFRPCSHASHLNAATAEAVNCNPFKGGHSLKTRFPFASYYYRPLIPLLQIMDKWSRDNNNGVYDYPNNRFIDEHNKTDILDGENCLRAAVEMHETFQEKVSLNPNLIERSIMFTQFYDGGSLFTHKNRSIWPLGISILNSNPSDRMEFGIGLFMIGLHDFAVDSNAAISLFKDLFAPELAQLAAGIEYSYINSSNEKVEIFLQARLVAHIMDSKATEKVAQIQGPNAYVGCTLHEGFEGVGRHRTVINRMVSIGTRCFLREKHPFRFFGVSKHCCPEKYYEGCKDNCTESEIVEMFSNFDFSLEPPPIRLCTARMVSYKENEVANISREQKVHTRLLERESAMKYLQEQRLKVGRPATIANKKECLEDLCEYTLPCEKMPMDYNSAVDSILANREFCIEDFGKFMYFAHCDFRKKVKYKRYPNSYYRAINKDSDTVAMNRGVHKTWVFDKIPSAGIKHALCWPAFHALLNFTRDMIFLLNGTIGFEYSELKLCVVEGRMPFLDCRGAGLGSKSKLTKAEKKLLKQLKEKAKSEMDEDCKAEGDDAKDNKFSRCIPYLLTKAQQRRCDAFHNCVIIPEGFKNNFGFLNPFTGTAFLNGHDKIVFITVFICFDILFTELPREYKAYFALVQSVLSDLLSPTISNVSVHDKVRDVSSVKELYDRVNEMLVVKESFFPDSVQHFTHHELTDVVMMIDELGPIRGWWEYCGERWVGVVKDCSANGGRSPSKTIHDTYADLENNKKNKYIPPKHMLDNSGRYRDNAIVLQGKITESKDVNVFQNSFVINSLMDAMLNYMETEVIDSKISTSPFYRLRMIYDGDKKIAQNLQLYLLENFAEYDTEPSFFQWIRSLCRTKFKLRGDKTHALFGKIITGASVDQITLQDLCNGNIYDFDISAVREISECASTFLWDEARIKGLEFHGRGLVHAETVEPVALTWPTTKALYGVGGVYTTSNELNDLPTKWSSSNAQTRSWCKFKGWHLKPDGLGGQYSGFSDVYGQINFFLRIRLPCDKWLDKLPFANITPRKPNYQTLLQSKSTLCGSIPYLDVYDVREHPAGQSLLEIFDSETERIKNTFNSMQRAQRMRERATVRIQTICLIFVAWTEFTRQKLPFVELAGVQT